VTHGAPSPVGAWTGQFRNIMPGKAYRPSQRAQFDAGKQKLAKWKVLITFRANHSYSLIPPNARKHAPPYNGEWSQSGLKVVLSLPGQPQGQTFVFSSDGKKLVYHNESPAVIEDLVLTK
jgi:hypothetical protein